MGSYEAEARPGHGQVKQYGVSKLEGNGPVESAGDRALKINAGLVVGVGDISLSAVDRVSNLRRPLSPRPFCSWGISFFSRRSFVICGQYDIM